MGPPFSEVCRKQCHMKRGVPSTNGKINIQCSLLQEHDKCSLNKGVNFVKNIKRMISRITF